MLKHRFKSWTIFYDPPPIGVRSADWHYIHENDDGAPDGSTARSGYAATLQDCLDAISDMVEETT